ncbi:MAG TPA: ferredoxin [bacterium]|nr:ferredoxin [bacterium]
MELEVNADTCIGCGLCVSIAPEVFEVSNNKAVVQELPVASENEDAAREAVEACPVSAIKTL